MQVIPVIDIKNGLVVHAQGGNRSAYAPLQSPLADGSDPVSVVEGFLRLHPFETLYVADLDGIMDGTPDLQTLHALAEAFPQLEIWLDNGMPNSGLAAEQFQELAGVRPVIGTESLRDGGEFVVHAQAITRSTGRAPILSLDFKGREIMGADLVLAPQSWPDTVIAMSLTAVGAREGPDDGLIKQLRLASVAPMRIVAAGGVRNAQDLATLAAAGADAVLVATALHAGMLKACDLVEIAGLQAHR